MKRRTFVAALAALFVVPDTLAATGEGSGGKRVALLCQGSEAQFKARLEVLRKALPGVVIEPHYAEGMLPRLATLARAIASSAPAAIVSDSVLATHALYEATATIPVVMARSEDPVGNRLVKTLEQPGGNVTGVVTGNLENALTAAQTLAAMMPAGLAIGVLLNQNNAAYRRTRSRIHYVAQKEKRAPIYLDASVRDEIAAAFASLKAEKVGGVVVMDDPMFLDEAPSIVKAANGARLPFVYPDRAFVEAGGLMALGGDANAAMAKAATYVERILAGAHPSQLAVETLPAQWSVNRATARAQGARIPAGVLKEARQA